MYNNGIHKCPEPSSLQPMLKAHSVTQADKDIYLNSSKDRVAVQASNLFSILGSNDGMNGVFTLEAKG